MNKLPVARTIIDAIVFPVRNFTGLGRRIGIAAIFSLVGTWTFAMVQGDDGAADPTNGYFWFALVAVTLGSLMIINGTIQVYLKHPLASRIWSLSNRELGQFAVSLLWIVLLGVIGVLLLITYWFLSLVLSASFGVELPYTLNTIAFGVLLSILIGMLIAIRLAPLPAFISDKNQFAVEASWGATRGHFWRIFLCLVVITLFYALLWMGGVFVGSLAAIPVIDGGLGEPSDNAKTWISANLSVLASPFTLYGQISVCAMLAAIYETTTSGENDAPVVDVETEAV